MLPVARSEQRFRLLSVEPCAVVELVMWIYAFLPAISLEDYASAERVYPYDASADEVSASKRDA